MSLHCRQALRFIVGFCAVWYSYQKVCVLQNQVVTSYDANKSLANVTLGSFRDLENSACQLQCQEAVTNGPITKCSSELLTCRQGSFNPDWCQPQVSCRFSLADSILITPQDDTDISWNIQDYALRCDCPPERYGPSCELVRPGMCDGTKGLVWDGTFVASATSPTAGVDPLTHPNEFDRDFKEILCYLKPSKEQPVGLMQTILSGVRHHRINITVGQQMANSTSQLRNLSFALTSRFRPGNNQRQNIGAPTAEDPQEPPWMFDCLDCSGIHNDAYTPALGQCNNWTRSSKNAGPITCLTAPGDPYPVPTSDDFEACSVPERPWLYPAYENEWYWGGECCGDATEWLSCDLTECLPECSGSSDRITYKCQNTHCRSHLPGYLNPKRMNPSINLIHQLPSIMQGESSIVFEGINYLKGTSSASQVNIPNSQSALYPFVFNMNCMTGSCTNVSDLPFNYSHLTLDYPRNSSASLTIDPFCSNHTAPPVPTPPNSNPSSHSVSVMTMTVACCIAVTMLVVIMLLFVSIEAMLLARQFVFDNFVDKGLKAVLLDADGVGHEAPDGMVVSEDPMSPLDILSPTMDGDTGLHFENVGYSVGERSIVQSVSGLIEPGQMVGVLGPSGAGKSSFLDILANRPKVGKVTGKVSAFCTTKIEAADFLKVNVAYVLQDDVLVPTDTVAETLLFAARAKNRNKNKAECIQRVKQVLKSLRLERVANTKIGNGVEGGGISGGERKRVSIGVELVSTPDCMVLDEPTSGLDSSSTIIVLDVLRKVAATGCSVVFSIHQPSLKAFLKFDAIVLLSCYGQHLFMGPPKSALHFFEDANHAKDDLFSPEVQAQLHACGSPRDLEERFDNPAELLLDAACFDPDDDLQKDRLHQLHSMFREHQSFQDLKMSMDAAADQNLWPLRQCKQPSGASADLCFWLLLKRCSRMVWRDSLLLVGHCVVTALIAGAIALFGRDLPLDFVGIQTRVFLFNFLVLYFAMVATSAMGALVKERSLFVRERAAGCYPTWCYVSTKIICDWVPLRTLPVIICAFILYWPVNLRDDDESFLKFLLSLLVTNYTASSSCLCISVICKEVGQANLFASAYIIYSFIFSGMLLTGGSSDAMNARYTSIFYFPWEAMCGAEFADESQKQKFNFNPKIGGDYVIPGPTHGLMEPTQAIMDNFNLEDRFAFDMGMMCLYSMFFITVSYLVLVFSRFPK